MRSSISCSILIIVFEDDSVFLAKILPSLVQKEFISRLFLAWFSFCTKYWRWRVRSSVITILSGLFFRLLLLLYILFFIFQFLKRHIICPFPLVIFPIICDRSMSSILSSTPRWSLQTLRTNPSVPCIFYQYFPESSSICNTGITSI
jgi:hypothetical protein